MSPVARPKAAGELDSGAAGCQGPSFHDRQHRPERADGCRAHGQKGLSPAGAVVLDRFRYRLAHVAMRKQQWDLASALRDAVLEGTGELTQARLYRIVCTLRECGRVDDDALRELVQRYRGGTGCGDPGRFREIVGVGVHYSPAGVAAALLVHRAPALGSAL